MMGSQDNVEELKTELTKQKKEMETSRKKIEELYQLQKEVLLSSPPHALLSPGSSYPT